MNGALRRITLVIVENSIYTFMVANKVPGCKKNGTKKWTWFQLERIKKGPGCKKKRNKQGPGCKKNEQTLDLVSIRTNKQMDLVSIRTEQTNGPGFNQNGTNKWTWFQSEWNKKDLVSIRMEQKRPGCNHNGTKMDLVAKKTHNR